MSTRLEAKLTASLNANEFYEAHQIYRTLFYRLSAAKDYVKLLSLLFNGALQLAQNKQFVSAIDLAELYADTLLNAEIPLDNTRVQEISQLLSSLPMHVSSDSEVSAHTDRRLRFLSKLIAWSQKVAQTPFERRRGAFAVHSVIGTDFRSKGEFEAARRHFMLANEPAKLAVVVAEYHAAEGQFSEVDLFAVVVALQLICLRRVNTAKTFIEEYCRCYKSIKSGTPTQFPLINFVLLLIDAIPSRNPRLFSLLLQQYATEYERESALKGYLDKIGQMFFGVPPPKSTSGGLFGSLFKGLFTEETEKPPSDSENDFEYENSEPMDVVMESQPGPSGVASASKPSTSSPAMKHKLQDNDDLD